MAHCAQCEVPITDPTVQVVHGDKVYCCANCAAAMEQGGSGSDPRTLSHAEDLRCSHCGVPIVDDSTLVSRDDQAFCCSNCAAAMAVS
jgi:DNA-directed RNA polymerase subunit RPC12/RpoP